MSHTDLDNSNEDDDMYLWNDEDVDEMTEEDEWNEYDSWDEDYDDSMDGDWDSTMRDCGFGTDEDYGYYGEDY